MSVRWVSVFLDLPAPVLDAAAAFWTSVTDSVVGEPVGDRAEFLPLEPSVGDPCLWLQRTQEGPVAVHPDLYVEDPAVEATRAEALGATVTDTRDGLVVASSPGGLPFCLVRHRDQVTRPEPVGPPGGRGVVDQLCLDIPPGRYDEESGFWSALTGWQRTGRDGSEFARLVRPTGIPYAFLLQRLEDDQPAVTAHLDLAGEDRDAVSERHVALGARLVRRTPEWTVLQDPAGVVYCVTDRRPGAV